MKALIITILLYLSTLCTFAINSKPYEIANSDTTTTLSDTLNKEPDTTIINLSNKKILIIKYKNKQKSKSEYKNADEYTENDKYYSDEDYTDDDETKRFKSHFASVEFGLNNYLTQNKSLNIDKNHKYMELEDSKSYTFAINFINFSIPLYRDKIGITSGLGLKYNNYKFDNKSNILMNDSSELYIQKDTLHNYSTNKLTSSYIILPIMLELHPLPNSERLWILFGAYGGVKVGSHTKLKTTSGDKTKVKKDFHLNTLIYGLRAQIGSGNWGLFCNYSLSILFKKDEGPELYPFSIGGALVF